MRYHTSELDSFVADIDSNYTDINNYPFRNEFELLFDSEINLGLDPFSEEYVQMQLNLYKEISGREINQDLYEQFERGQQSQNSHLITSANPLGSEDLTHLATHMRAISSMLQIANLPVAASILDVGAGWGLTSEMMAYAGGKVTAIDINPDFIELISQRANRLGLPITAITCNFDNYVSLDKYDAIIFYESLHHSIYPLELLRRYAGFLKPSGKILFCGEPVNDRWPDWGLRTDAESVYVMRKYGWFESGWSEKYVIRLFDLAGLELKLLPWSGLRNGYVGIAMAQKGFTKEAFHLGEGSPAHLFEIYKKDRR